jgi:spoIIIJ-associated protein
VSGPSPDRQREGGDRSRSNGTGNRNGKVDGPDGSHSEQPGDLAAEKSAGTGVGSAGKGTGGSNRRSRSRSGNPSEGNRSNQQIKQASGRASGDREDNMEESLTLEQQGEAAQQFLSGLVEEFGLDATISFSEVDEETVQVAAVGDDLGLLVGPRGATLSAVQDLTRTFVQRQSENRTDRILVDVGGYREKRNAALRRFAGGIAEDVKGSGNERALEPMSAADRKVIHDAINDIDGVATRSDGMEPTRYVVIAPA